MAIAMETNAIAFYSELAADVMGNDAAVVSSLAESAIRMKRLVSMITHLTETPSAP